MSTYINHLLDNRHIDHFILVQVCPYKENPCGMWDYQFFPNQNKLRIFAFKKNWLKSNNSDTYNFLHATLRFLFFKKLHNTIDMNAHLFALIKFSSSATYELLWLCTYLYQTAIPCMWKYISLLTYARAKL